MKEIDHPFNGEKQQVQEESLEELVLKCGKCFEILEIRNDGYISTGSLYSDLDSMRTNKHTFIGKGMTMKECVADLYSQLLTKWLEIGQAEETLKDAGYNTGVKYN